ncbi:MAG: hypothetical protein LUI02_05990 [Clostridiales bacterium]|nr:hypothetical protein [Clostridiales bacterium]
MKYIEKMNKKSKVIKVMALALAFCLTMGIAQRTVMASTYDYTSFKYIFNGGSGIPSSATHITQTVEVKSNADEYAYAECTSFSYTGNVPVLTVQSASTDEYPTYSASFTETSEGKPMKYTKYIPTRGTEVTFKGTVTNYNTYFSISAAVKG